MGISNIFFKRHLPHLHFKDGIYFITARLYDPNYFIHTNTINNFGNIALNNNLNDFKEHFTEYDDLLHNANYKINYLKNPENADILKNIFHFYDKIEYNLIAYTILSNHFHINFELLKDNQGISKIMQLIKGKSAFLINKNLNRNGKLWQDESYDRWVRDDKELYFVIRYILMNPVKAGLVNEWSEWKYTYCNPDYLIL